LGLSSVTTLNLVAAAPTISLSLDWQVDSLSLTWAGGIPPYQVQWTTNLANPMWQNWGAPFNGNSLLIPHTNSAAFYRVLGQ
jgi:hypothetical protein